MRCFECDLEIKGEATVREGMTGNAGICHKTLADCVAAIDEHIQKALDASWTLMAQAEAAGGRILTKGTDSVH